mgnify:CR=1 FL=1
MKKVVGYQLLPNGLYRALYEDLGPVPSRWSIGDGSPIVMPESEIITYPSNYTGERPEGKSGARPNMTGKDGYAARTL